MLVMTRLTKAALATGLYACLGTAAGPMVPAWAEGRAADLDKVITCHSTPKNLATTTLIIHLEGFSIPAFWDDPGSHYEVVTTYRISVYADEKEKSPICVQNGDWGTREFPMFNVSSGGRWQYPLDFKIIINNVPVGGNVKFTTEMSEQDSSSSSDWIDIDPHKKYLGPRIIIYPWKKRAYLAVSDGTYGEDSQHTILFGKSKRIIGDGAHTGVREPDVIGSLDLTIDTGKSIAPKPGTAPKKVGGAVSASACQQYAQTAIDLNSKATQLNCGFAPPVWSNDYQQHLNWCMHGNNSAQAASANTDRKKQIAACEAKKAASTKDQGCRDYALKAVEFNQQAIALKCGYAPPVWSNDHQMHFDWCMRGNNSAQASGENTKRAQAIAACKTKKAAAPPPPPSPPPSSAAQFCQSYAQGAIDQFHTAAKRNCGLFGPEWSPDYGWHYNWCVQMYNSGQSHVVMAGSAKRAQMLQGCP